MITRGFYTALGRLLANADPAAVVAEVGFGTGNTSETFDDTTLTGAYRKPIERIEVVADNPRQLRAHWALERNEANGLPIREIGLFTADDVLIARVTRASAIEKTPDMELGDWFELTL
ncbi:hypothetical protein R5R73_01320 [Salinicola sp. LHM]|uniref:hypothetical protein n=1 Tax=Salinicola sp. LHM TaxID=3065298 RepID=UPI002ACD303D|nr:hypothetical protein [Salinicola sp. LHM]WQH33367.1 hypothetical protein R5R73_01320 [Salinicola sp. LHM]